MTISPMTGHRQCILRAATAFFCASALLPSVQAAESVSTPILAPIAWTDAQMKAANINTQSVSSAGVSPGVGLVLQGTVELPPQATELLSTPLAGVVQQILVSPGQRVKAGEAVAQLRSAELVTWQRELLQAQAQARLTATKLERDEKLYAEGIIAGLRLQDSRTQHELAKLALQERRQMLKMAGFTQASASLQPILTLRAATTGTVLEVTATPGQKLDAGESVAKLARGGQLAIALQASVEQAQNLRVGVLLALEGCKAPARLSAMVPQVSAGNQSVQLRASFTAPEDCLRVNQFVRATVLSPSASVGAAASGVVDQRHLGVPAQAVVRHQGKAYVFVRTAKGFVPTPVELAEESGNILRVRSGLKEGEIIVVQGTAGLKAAWQGIGTGAP